jgi:hypothetical protein
MICRAPRASAAGIVLFAFVALTTPADAQTVTFAEIRDAVPLKFFNPDPDGTRVDPADPNTLIIGFESGRNPVDLLDSEFRASTSASGHRIAMDTLSFTVIAPAGYYVSSITYQQVGSGSLSRVADARGGTNWIVAGRPAALGTFRTNPALTQTLSLSDPALTIVPISITTALAAFANPGDATVEITGASVTVSVAPIESNPAKKSAIIDVSGFSGTYDGKAHGPSGTATGADGEDLSGLLSFGETFTDAPGGLAHWTFAGDATYNAASGTAAITIERAEASINVAGFTGVYDGAAHGATGTATGVNNEILTSLLDLGASFTNVPGGIAHWTFTGGTNYNPASGEVAISLTKATPALVWPQPAPVAAGTILSDVQLNATASVPGTFVYSPPAGTVLTGTQQLSVVFTPADSGNYNGAAASVTITVQAADAGVRIVNPGPQTDSVGDDVRLRLRVRGGSPAARRGTFSATGLPAGLAIERDGDIRGELRAEGTSHVVVTFSGSGGVTSAEFDWTVLPRTKRGGGK